MAMLSLVLAVLRSAAAALQNRRQVVLKNLALRDQLMVFSRTVKIALPACRPGNPTSGAFSQPPSFEAQSQGTIPKLNRRLIFVSPLRAGKAPLKRRRICRFSRQPCAEPVHRLARCWAVGCLGLPAPLAFGWGLSDRGDGARRWLKMAKIERIHCLSPPVVLPTPPALRRPTPKLGADLREGALAHFFFDWAFSFHGFEIPKRISPHPGASWLGQRFGFGRVPAFAARLRWGKRPAISWSSRRCSPILDRKRSAPSRRLFRLHARILIDADHDDSHL